MSPHCEGGNNRSMGYHSRTHRPHGCCTPMDPHIQDAPLSTCGLWTLTEPPQHGISVGPIFPSMWPNHATVRGETAHAHTDDSTGRWWNPTKQKDPLWLNWPKGWRGESLLSPCLPQSHHHIDKASFPHCGSINSSVAHKWALLPWEGHISLLLNHTLCNPVTFKRVTLSWEGYPPQNLDPSEIDFFFYYLKDPNLTFWSLTY